MRGASGLYSAPDTCNCNTHKVPSSPRYDVFRTKYSNASCTLRVNGAHTENEYYCVLE